MNVDYIIRNIMSLPSWKIDGSKILVWENAKLNSKKMTQAPRSSTLLYLTVVTIESHLDISLICKLIYCETRIMKKYSTLKFWF